jgi:putative IMPACT (imprinted ancient) family translation regulator
MINRQRKALPSTENTLVRIITQTAHDCIIVSINNRSRYKHTYKESSIKMQFDGSEFILFAASIKLEYQNRSKLAITKKNALHVSTNACCQYRLQNCTTSHMSGDGFPFDTSSAPTIAEKDSSHPIYHMEKITVRTPY